MKLLDKIKDLFMDEVLDEDELELEEEEKEEYKAPAKNELPKVMRETISREEKREAKSVDIDVVKEEKKEEPTNKKFNFPVDFDTDLVEDKKRETVKEKKWDIPEEFNHSNINVLQLEKETSRRVSELYANKKTEDKNVKPKFKASPVISPVYGILDKNYKKDEVKEKTDDVTMMKRPSKKVDFETVRKKAFGNLVDDIKDNMLCENCELYKEVKKISALKEDDLLYEMTVDDEDNADVTIEKAYDDYEEFGVAYEPNAERNKHVDEAPVINDSNQEEEPTFTSIKEKIETEEVEVTQNVTVVPEDEIKEEVKEKKIPSRSEEKKDSKVDDDFFELIDSMYKERTDE